MLEWRVVALRDPSYNLLLQGCGIYSGNGCICEIPESRKNGSFMLSMQLNGYLIGFQVNNSTNDEIISFFEFTVRTTQIHLHFPSFTYPGIVHHDTSKHAMFLPIFFCCQNWVLVFQNRRYALNVFKTDGL